MIGSIVINSQSAVQTLYCFSDTTNDSINSGNHIQGRYNGKWWLNDEGYEFTVVDVPAANKTVKVSTNTDTGLWTKSLPNLDDNDKLRVVDKYSNLLKTMDNSNPWTAVLNTTISPGGDSDTIGSMNILWNKTPMYFSGLVDEHDNVQFLFSDFDVIPQLKLRYPMKYYHYRFPVYDRGSVFFNTQNICHKWWTWSQSLADNKLKAFNALERLLFKHLQ